MSGEDILDFQVIAEISTNIANECIQSVLESNTYNPGKSSDWVDKIGSKIIDKLKLVSPNFKYIVSCFIIQKVGAGVHYESVSHWDAKSDGGVTTKYENDSMLCICTVFGVAI